MKQQNTGYPFFYGDELTPKMPRENRKKILAILLLSWSLKVNRVQAVPPSADGFTPTHICRKRQTDSRQVTVLSTRLKENPAIYDRHLPGGLILEDLQIRKKFKHAPDFGIFGKPNRKNYELFKNKIEEHMTDPSTIIKKGTYDDVLHYLHYCNEQTGLNVLIRQNDGTFLTGWEVNCDKNYSLKKLLDKNSLLLKDFRYWESRKLYIQLMEKFVNGRIHSTEFDSEFCRMRRIGRDKNYSMKNLLDKAEAVEFTKFKGFSALILDLFIYCDVFEPGSDLRADYEISEEELKNGVKETLLKIKERYP